jgi:hypothetical protein
MAFSVLAAAFKAICSFLAFPLADGAALADSPVLAPGSGVGGVAERQPKVNATNNRETKTQWARATMRQLIELF